MNYGIRYLIDNLHMVHRLITKLFYPIFDSNWPVTFHLHMVGVSNGYIITIFSEDMNRF